MASNEGTPPVVSTIVVFTLLLDNLMRLNLSSEGDTAVFLTSLLITCTVTPSLDTYDTVKDTV